MDGLTVVWCRRYKIVDRAGYSRCMIVYRAGYNRLVYEW